MERRDIANAFDGAPVYYVPVTDSTMNDARRLSEHGAINGTVVFAGSQNLGRGRFADRSWVSETGTGVLMTVILDRELSDLPAPIGAFPLLAGLALSRVLEQDFSFDVAVKWPNDVLVHGKKVSGILCEATRTSILCGVGVNCNQLGFPGDLRNATSIARELGRPVDPERVIARFLVELRVIVTGGRQYPWRREIERRLAGKDAEVEVASGLDRTPVKGILRGVCADGSLELEIAGAKKSFPSAEILLRS